HLRTRSRGWEWHGDAVDIALLALGHKLGWRREFAAEEFPQLDAIPFESEHQYAASFHQVGDQTRVFVKGSPERVLSLCSAAADRDWVRRWEDQAHEMADRGYRVLALAEGPSEIRAGHAPAEPTGLNLLGMVGMI